MTLLLDAPQSTQHERAKQSQADAGYWKPIDGLRAIAFLLVFISHLGGIAPFPAGTFMNKLANCGWVGVDLFFVISGFLITALLLREKEKYGSISFKQFYLRRALRILPVYYLVLFIACFAVPMFGVADAPRWNGAAAFFWPVFVPFLFFFGNYTMAWRRPQIVSLEMRKGVNLDTFLSPFWSLCVEEQFYLCWPFLVSKLKSAKALLLTCLSLTALAVVIRQVLYVYATTHPDVIAGHMLYYTNTVCRLDTLMIGAAIAVTHQYFPTWFGGLKRLGPLFFLLSVGAFGMMVHSGINICENPVGIVPVMSGVAFMFGSLLLASLFFQPFGWLMSSAPIAHFGRLTYAMYCFHVPVLNEVGKHLHLTGWASAPYVDWTIKLIISLACTYLLALLSWHLMEKRCMELRKVLHKRMSRSA